MRNHIAIGIRVSARRGVFCPARKAKHDKSVAYVMVSLANLLRTAYGILIGITAGRPSRSTFNFKLRRQSLVVSPFSHFLLSATPLRNPQGMMIKTILKYIMPVMGRRGLCTAQIWLRIRRYLTGSATTSSEIKTPSAIAKASRIL